MICLEQKRIREPATGSMRSGEPVEKPMIGLSLCASVQNADGKSERENTDIQYKGGRIRI